MALIKNSLGHIKHHLSYPSTKKDLVAARNNMADLPAAERDWFAKTLPEGIYKSPEDVLKSLLAKA